MAQAGARFADSLLRALNGETGIVEPTFVESDVAADKGCEFFSTNVELGPEGVKKIHGLGPVNAYEEKLLSECYADLKGNIAKGVSFK